MIRLLRRRREAAPQTPAPGDAAPDTAAPPGADTRAAAGAEPPAAQDPAPAGAGSRPDPAGPAPYSAVCDRFAMQVLVLAEQQRQALDHLERDEADPERLKRLYDVDHAVAMMRRAARELRVLAEVDDGDPGGGGDPASVLDIVRMATSSIDSYQRVQTGTVAELAVHSYATDDVASILAPLLDNAARYSPGNVSVSAHPTEHGGVVVRIADSGIGLKDEHVRNLNETMAGTLPPVDDRTGRHTGFPVVHRLAHRHGVGVHFSSRPGGSAGGTTVVVSLPANLICDIPAPPPALGELPAQDDTAPAPAPEPAQGPAPVPSAADRPAAPPPRPAHLSVAPGPLGAGSAPPAEPPPPSRPPAGDLPRRERKSLRPDDTTPARRRRPLASGGDAPEPPGGSFADDLDAFAPGAGTDPTAPGRRPDDDSEVW
ncbi:hypothetical protein GCM10027570_06570 [Streptomonospora sediminis]